MWRVGIVQTSAATERSAKGLVRGLVDLGYVDGKNIVLIQQRSDANTQAVASAILSLIPAIDLLVVGGTVGGVAAKKLVTSLPVVFVAVGAPIEIGLVESLSRPGGNMTGITFEAAAETYGKRLQILKEILPTLSRVAVLQAQEDANAKFAMASLERAAPDLARFAGLRGQTLVDINRKQFIPHKVTGSAVRYRARENNKWVTLPVLPDLQTFLTDQKVQRADGLICVRDDGTAWASEKEMQTRVSHWLRDRERDGHIGAGTTLHRLRVSYAAWSKRATGATNREVADLLGDEIRGNGRTLHAPCRG